MNILKLAILSSVALNSAGRAEEATPPTPAEQAIAAGKEAQAEVLIRSSDSEAAAAEAARFGGLSVTAAWKERGGLLAAAAFGVDGGAAAAAAWPFTTVGDVAATGEAYMTPPAVAAYRAGREARIAQIRAEVGIPPATETK
jgi:hypothetical protein